MAHGCNATPIEETARVELVATGARPRRVMRTGVASLTPSELRVARMAAEGMENREIAQRLFLSVKTVETHLGHVYRKLGISSRKELPEALRG
jgi:DNA-binding CsgD family transcriptional regulator